MSKEDTTTNKEDPVVDHALRAKETNDMRFTLTEVPPWYLTILLGVQHFFVFLGATVLIPLLVTPAMGATRNQTAQVISTIFVVTGFNTLVQTTIGDRLPIVQGGSFAFLTPTFSIIGNPELQAIEDPNERFLETMRVLSGAIFIMGIVQTIIGYTGVLVPVLRYISPITIAPVIAVLGLSLYNVGFSNVSSCFPLGLTQMGLTILFAMYLKKLNISGYPIFALFPVILALCLTWSLGAILTAADVWEEGNTCRTDSTRDIEAPFFRIPFPGQWGAPIFKAWAIVPMIGAMVASMIESIGDYYSCARLSGAPPPTPGIVSRGLGGEGIGVILAGLFGSASGTTSYSENIGALSLTRVGSRVVVQVSALVAIGIGILGKVSAALASLPSGIVGGIYCIVFGLLVAVGLSNLQYVNLNNQRNLFIIGFSLFNAMSISGPAGYFASQASNPFGTGNGAEILRAFFSSPLIIALLCGLILDNTVPGATREERGLQVWDALKSADLNNDPQYTAAYGLPKGLAQLFRNCGYLEYFGRGCTMPDPPSDGVYRSAVGTLSQACCPRLCPTASAIPQDDAKAEDSKEVNFMERGDVLDDKMEEAEKPVDEVSA